MGDHSMASVDATELPPPRRKSHFGKITMICYTNPVEEDNDLWWQPCDHQKALDDKNMCARNSKKGHSFEVSSSGDHDDCGNDQTHSKRRRLLECLRNLFRDPRYS